MTASTNRALSRGFEALVGATLGGTAAGALGALSYEPTKPREWIDERGNIYSRPLTREEQKTRLAVSTASALAGALGGAGLSMGGSGLLRARVTSLERDASKELVDDALQPLKELLGDWTAKRTALLVAKPGYSGVPIAKHMDNRIQTARVMLRKQEKTLTGLVDEAAKRRATLPFTRVMSGPAKGSKIDWDPFTHKGLVKEHFDSFAKKHGDPLDNAYDVFTKAVTAKMTKTSEAAFLAELEKIGFKMNLSMAKLTKLPGLAAQKGLKTPKIGPEMTIPKVTLKTPSVPNPTPGS